MRERSRGAWELIVEARRDPVSGRRRQVSRIFHGNPREAKKARAELIVEASRGRHSGARATMDDLFDAWIVELRRKGRSPNTVLGYERKDPAGAVAYTATEYLDRVPSNVPAAFTISLFDETAPTTPPTEVLWSS